MSKKTKTSAAARDAEPTPPTSADAAPSSPATAAIDAKPAATKGPSTTEAERALAAAHARLTSAEAGAKEATRTREDAELAFGEGAAWESAEAAQVAERKAHALLSAARVRVRRAEESLEQARERASRESFAEDLKRAAWPTVRASLEAHARAVVGHLSELRSAITRLEAGVAEQRELVKGLSARAKSLGLDAASIPQRLPEGYGRALVRFALSADTCPVIGEPLYLAEPFRVTERAQLIHDVMIGAPPGRASQKLDFGKGLDVTEADLLAVLEGHVVEELDRRWRAWQANTAPAARTVEYSAAAASKLLEGLRLGHPLTSACSAAGVTVAQANAWASSGGGEDANPALRSFATAFRRATAHRPEDLAPEAHA